MQEKSDHLQLLGKVSSAVHEIYEVDTPEGMIKGKLSGRLRFNKIQILIGDYVELRVSAYDLTHGQIVRRLSENEFRRMSAPKPAPKNMIGRENLELSKMK